MAKVIRKELEQKLAALDGAEWDSMSESDLSGDDINETSDGEELKPPPLPLHAQKKKRSLKGKGKASVIPVGPAGEPSGVVRIGHIPHGFYEEAMNGFFKQFGDVIRVRISRSKKSGRCKGYAYVEFVSPEVAVIVAETMNGYYLFDKQLICRVLRFDEIHPNLFDGAGVKFKKVNWHGLYRQKYNVDRTAAKDEKHAAKLVKSDKAKKDKLANLGIEYDFPGFVATLNDRQVSEEPHQGLPPKKQPKSDKAREAEKKAKKARKAAEAEAAAEASTEEAVAAGAAGAKKPPAKTKSAKKPAATAAAATATTPKGKKGNAKTPAKKSTAPAAKEGVEAEAASADGASSLPNSRLRVRKKKRARREVTSKKGKTQTPPNTPEPTSASASGSGKAKAKGSEKKSKGPKTPEAAAGGEKAKGSAKKRKAPQTPEPAVAAAAAAAAAAGAGSGGKKKAKSPKSGGGGGKKRSLEGEGVAATPATAAPATGSGKKPKSAKRSKV